jgi:nucleotide-binding universal stress UspA family protein
MSGIVLGYDDSASARAAMEWAARQAQQTGQEVYVVYVISSLAEWELAAIQVNSDPIRRAFDERLRTEWTESLRARRIPYHTRLAIGRVAEQLMEVARAEDANMIVIGMTSRGTISDLVSRSTMRDLRGNAVRPVVAVPATWSPA